jgi:hypothetical protein
MSVLSQTVGISHDDLLEFYIDNEKNMEILKSIFQRFGKKMAMIQYQLDKAPSQSEHIKLLFSSKK